MPTDPTFSDTRGIEAVSKWHRAVVLVLTLLGLLSQRHAIRSYFTHRHRQLNTVMWSLLGLVLADVCLVVDHFVQSITWLSVGHIADNGWCQILAWASVDQLILLQGSLVITAFATYRLVMRHPLRRRVLWMLTGGNHLMSVGITTWMAARGYLGPYKGLYCCIRSRHYMHTVYVTLAFVFFNCVGVTTLYALSFVEMRRLERTLVGTRFEEDRRGSNLMFRRGLVMVVLAYVWFGLFLVPAVLMAAKVIHEIPLAVDVAASFVVKLGPIFSGYYVTRLVKKTVNRDMQTFQPIELTRLSKPFSPRAPNLVEAAIAIRAAVKNPLGSLKVYAEGAAPAAS